MTAPAPDPSRFRRSPRPAADAPPSAPGDGVVRLNKRLADLGLCSRREADEWIERGWVRVNGQVAVMGLRWGRGTTSAWTAAPTSRRRSA